MSSFIDGGVRMLAVLLQDDFRLEVKGRFFLVAEFPSAVDDSLVKATFNKTVSQLLLKVPVLSVLKR